IIDYYDEGEEDRDVGVVDAR
nr:RecName: Full=Fibrinogen beta chain; Contains: RecName: Full=Fibrinopeptide B [Felis catus]prf//650771U fibrinopeptide B [Felis catus]